MESELKNGGKQWAMVTVIQSVEKLCSCECYKRTIVSQWKYSWAWLAE